MFSKGERKGHRDKNIEINQFGKLVTRSEEEAAYIGLYMKKVFIVSRESYLMHNYTRPIYMGLKEGGKQISTSFSCFDKG